MLTIKTNKEYSNLDDEPVEGNLWILVVVGCGMVLTLRKKENYMKKGAQTSANQQ